MGWYKTELSANDVRKGKSSQLKDRFLNAMLGRGEFIGIALFTEPDPKEQGKPHTYYLNPKAATFMLDELGDFDWTECEKPVGRDIHLVAGDSSPASFK